MHQKPRIKLGLTQPLALEKVGGHPTAGAQGLDFSLRPADAWPSTWPVPFRPVVAGLALRLLGKCPKGARRSECPCSQLESRCSAHV